MEKDTKRKQLIKKIAGIFLVVMLVLTFFSNTIMNYSLPEVATETVTTGTVSNKVRGQGAVETNSDYEVTVSGTRVIKEVKFEAGDTVKKGEVLFTFEEGENAELTAAEDELADKELQYAKSLLKQLPDYTTDNMDIKDAQDALKKAKKEKEDAEKNAKALKTAKKEEKSAKEKFDAQQEKVDALQEQVDAYGEVGDYDSAQEDVKNAEAELASLKTQLSDLQIDLEDAKEAGEDTKQLEREIRDKKLDATIESKKGGNILKTTSASYKDTKDNLTKEKKILEDYQKVLEEKTAKVAELSAKTTLEDAKANVKEKQDTLTKLLINLSRTKEADGIAQQQENLDMKDALDEINQLKAKIEKLRSSSDVKQIKATADGVISQIEVDEGDSVEAAAVLAKIQMSESGYLVKIKVTKAQSKLIKVGDEATVENVWDEDLVAEVKSIKADPENPNQSSIVTFEVKGNVDVGQNLSLSVGDKSNRYDAVVPNSAIKEDSNGKFVLIVTVKGTPLGNRYKIKRADVEVLASDDTSSGVSGGVYEYDNVVTNSSKPLEEGMQVRLVD